MRVVGEELLDGHADLGDHRGGGVPADPGDGGQQVPPALKGLHHLLDPGVQPGDSRLQVVEVVQVQDNASMVHGKHVMKWGGYRSSTAKKKAIVVVAHAMIVIIWHIMVTGKPYHELGAGYFASLQDPERETRRLIAKLQALGHTVTINPAA